MPSTAQVPRRIDDLATYALLWCAGLYLRLTLLVAPPLANHIGDALNLSQTGIGALTTVPLLMLSLAAVAGAFLITRIGARRTVIVALLLILAGSSFRGAATSPWFLFVATGVMGLGIAALQPALPSLLTRWCPDRIALGTAIYMNGMLMGEVLSAGLTLPLVMPLTGENWRLALLAWSLPASLVALGFYLRGDTTAAPAPPVVAHWMPAWRSPVVWQLGLLLGATAGLFFGTNAYMGSVLRARNEAELLATGLLLFNSAQLAASLFMLRQARRWVGRTTPMLAMLAASATALLLFLLLDGLAALIAATALSFASGVLLILLVSLPPMIASGGRTASLSAGMFTVGYAVSFLVPLAGGRLADASGLAGGALLPLLVYTLLVIPVCVRLGATLEGAGRHR